jgi:hypothetical protein
MSTKKIEVTMGSDITPKTRQSDEVSDPPEKDDETTIELARIRAIVKGRGWALRSCACRCSRGKTIRYVFWDGLGDLWCESLAEVDKRLRNSAYRAPPAG